MQETREDFTDAQKYSRIMLTNEICSLSARYFQFDVFEEQLSQWLPVFWRTIEAPLITMRILTKHRTTSKKA